MSLPLFQVFGQLASGVSESLLSLASATVILPTVSLLGAIFSYGRRIISTATDGIMLGLIKRFGRQPDLDSALAWKVRGAGVARQYMNSIEIDDVKFLVRKTERNQLNLGKKTHYYLLKKNNTAIKFIYINFYLCFFLKR